jgi:hypothetical protein
VLSLFSCGFYDAAIDDETHAVVFCSLFGTHTERIIAINRLQQPQWNRE